MKKVLLLLLMLFSLMGTIETMGMKLVVQVLPSSESVGKGVIRYAPPVRVNQSVAELNENALMLNFVASGSTIVLTIFDDDGVIIYEVTSVASSSSCSVKIPDGIMEEGEPLTIIINGKSYEANW